MGPSRASEPGRAERDSLLPRSFGRYLLFDRIGRGGMADIYLARAKTELGGARLAVVKQIVPRLSEDPDFSAMLVAEAKLAAQLSHANIVQVFDLGREQDGLYIAMEYVEGFDLNQLLRRLTKARIGLPASYAIHIVCEVLRALDYAHRARDQEGQQLHVVHRDLSPSNVLISFEGEVKLCDFGIARALGAAHEQDQLADATTERARVAGKSAYMAPEHARGEAIDARADLFATGILLWELCAGRRLYRGDEAQMLEQARRGEVPPLPERGLREQPQLQAILSRALAFDPDARYRQAGEMLADLNAYAVSAGLGASPLALGSFLTDHLAGDIVEIRRARERAAAALERGPPVVMTPIDNSETEHDEEHEDGEATGESERSDDVADAPEASSDERDEDEARSAGGEGTREPESPSADKPSSGEEVARASYGEGSHAWLWALLIGTLLVTAFVMYFGTR